MIVISIPIHRAAVVLYQKSAEIRVYPILNLKPVKGSEANSADPDQMPHNVASDQGLQCLLLGFSIKNRIKATKWTRHP